MRIMMLALLLLLSGCRDPHQYPKDTVEKIVTECLEAGGTYMECSCAAKQTQQTYTYDEYRMLEANPPDEPPEPLVRALAPCKGLGRP